jgi:hypothetical protein
VLEAELLKLRQALHTGKVHTAELIDRHFDAIEIAEHRWSQQHCYALNLRSYFAVSGHQLHETGENEYS